MACVPSGQLRDPHAMERRCTYPFLLESRKPVSLVQDVPSSVLLVPMTCWDLKFRLVGHLARVCLTVSHWKMIHVSDRGMLLYSTRSSLDGGLVISPILEDRPHSTGRTPSVRLRTWVRDVHGVCRMSCSNSCST